MKSKLQFGKLTLTGLVSQQNSESRTVNTQGGVQTTDFSIKADDYDANRHFFLAQYFYDNYDTFASRLPHVTSGINITRIEVWVTNKNGNYDESRNFVGFMDLGENTRLANDYWTPNHSLDVPSNLSNNLLDVIKKDYPGARDISTVTQALAPLQAYGITGGATSRKWRVQGFCARENTRSILLWDISRLSQRSLRMRCWPWHMSIRIKGRCIR